MERKVMTNLLRVSRVSDRSDFPLRASTLYKWIYTKEHQEFFVRLGGAVDVNLDKLDTLLAKGSTVRKGQR